jgi:hypothetical protein
MLVLCDMREFGGESIEVIALYETDIGAKTAIKFSTSFLRIKNVVYFLFFILFADSSSSYPYLTKWGPYNMFSSCCEKDSIQLKAKIVPSEARRSLR